MPEEGKEKKEKKKNRPTNLPKTDELLVESHLRQVQGILTW